MKKSSPMASRTTRGAQPKLVDRLYGLVRRRHLPWLAAAGVIAALLGWLAFSPRETPPPALPELAATASTVQPGVSPGDEAAAGAGDEAAAPAGPQTETKPSVESPPTPVAQGAVAPEPAWTPVRVERGDTLARIFKRLGFSPALVHRLATMQDYGPRLTRLRPGEVLDLSTTDDGTLDRLRVEWDEAQWLVIELDDQHTRADLVPRAIERRVRQVEAEIQSSLFVAGQNAGLEDNTILRLAGIFGWDIDFALDIRRGDRFALIFEEIYRDGQYLRQGPILAARFINQGQSYTAIRFDAGNGPDYFAPDGRPMRKAFLRAPLNFTRVTSNFNPRRFHPVTRKIRPHNGVDYGAPTGTPVWAAGDGTVIEAGYSPANGNYIFIQHGNHIVTRYLHLSRKHVKRGDRVRQGQVIGRVGATGLATGPHLHYEFLVHGRHRDPRQVELPPADPLPADRLPEFSAQAEPLLAQLDALLERRTLLAGRNGEDAGDEARDQAGRGDRRASAGLE